MLEDYLKMTIMSVQKTYDSIRRVLFVTCIVYTNIHCLTTGAESAPSRTATGKHNPCAPRLSDNYRILPWGNWNKAKGWGKITSLLGYNSPFAWQSLQVEEANFLFGRQ